MTHHILATLQRASRPISLILRDERGSAAIEYGLMAALIAVAAIQALSSLGVTTAATFASAEEAMAGDADREVTPILPRNP